MTTNGKKQCPACLDWFNIEAQFYNHEGWRDICATCYDLHNDKEAHREDAGEAPASDTLIDDYRRLVLAMSARIARLEAENAAHLANVARMEGELRAATFLKTVAGGGQ